VRSSHYPGFEIRVLHLDTPPPYIKLHFGEIICLWRYLAGVEVHSGFQCKVCGDVIISRGQMELRPRV